MLFGPKPIDRQSAKVQLFEALFSASKYHRILKITSLSFLDLEKFVSKSDLIFVVWLCFQGLIGIRNVKKSFYAVNWHFNIQVNRKYEILLDR